MSLNAQGVYATSSRPHAPEGWPSGYVRHHMIDWVELRGLWNALVNNAANHGATEPLVRYMNIIGFGPERARQSFAGAVVAGDIHQARGVSIEELETCICWQGYNIFLGFGTGSRRPHVPDPHRLIDLRVYGATSFDWPPVAPPNGHRLSVLHRAFQEIIIICGAPANRPLPNGPVQSALTLLESVEHLDYLPPHEINWWALSKKHFWGMTPRQRETYFNACLAAGIREADGEAVYAATFGSP